MKAHRWEPRPRDYRWDCRDCGSHLYAYGEPFADGDVVAARDGTRIHRSRVPADCGEVIIASVLQS